MTALEAIRKAFEIELGGHAFYERAALEAQEPMLQDLFGRFAAMEQEHMATLSRRYHADLPGAVADFQLDRAAIFAGVDRKPEDPANLFRIAIAFEAARRARSSREQGRAAASGLGRAGAVPASSPPRSASTSRSSPPSTAAGRPARPACCSAPAQRVQ